MSAPPLRMILGISLLGVRMLSATVNQEILQADDACSPARNGDGSCSLSMKQLRGEQLLNTLSETEHEDLAPRIGCDPKTGGLCPGGIPCPADGWCPIGSSVPTRHLQPGPISPNRLTIINGCSASLWIAHIAAGAVGPDPQDIKIEPGQSHKFITGSGPNGLTAVRYWAKLGCNGSGSNCTIGDSGGPGEACVIRNPGQPDDYSKCAPPVDTKFEGTFASVSARRDKDIIDMSLVDGYTLPFKLEVKGTCTRHGIPFEGMNCSGLSLERCPSAQTVAGVGIVDLRAINPSTDEIAGCYSTCLKITDDKWGSPVGGPDSVEAAPYCCAGTYGTPGVCNGGPVVDSHYLQEVHEMCQEAYGYAYDDVRATIACDPDTEYELTYYCPDV
eukprot:TRINITY_DN58433_c0_g1_i1.p1 TRINITY_DN58433_c0_g1~~TRINITY_DN58433_c0_g1_i1.p1  ORF type:complete len:387 (-),score=41.07 TRINITY_DN58433_c0_g1_i1:326-1486(-)